MSDPIALSPTHLALIEDARRHADHRLAPPARVRGRARRLLAEKLIVHGAAELIASPDEPWWTDPERGPLGLRLAASMRDAAPAADHPVEASPAPSEANSAAGGGKATDRPADQQDGPSPVEPQPWTKIARVLGLLRRPEGADLQTIVSATEWLPHTARAALTGLRRKGHAIVASRGEDGPTVYHVFKIAAEAPAEADEAATLPDAASI